MEEADTHVLLSIIYADDCWELERAVLWTLEIQESY